MSLWSYLFDRDEIDVRPTRNPVSIDNDSLEHIQNAFESLRLQVSTQKREIGRLQLVCEGLVNLLEQTSGFDRKDLLLMVQRLDLADGVEDNRIGPNRLEDAPRCDHCGRPLNLLREQCIYCFAPITEAMREQGKAQAAISDEEK